MSKRTYSHFNDFIFGQSLHQIKSFNFAPHFNPHLLSTHNTLLDLYITYKVYTYSIISKALYQSFQLHRTYDTFGTL